MTEDSDEDYMSVVADIKPSVEILQHIIRIAKSVRYSKPSYLYSLVQKYLQFLSMNCDDISIEDIQNASLEDEIDELLDGEYRIFLQQAAEKRRKNEELLFVLKSIQMYAQQNQQQTTAQVEREEANEEEDEEMDEELALAIKLSMLKDDEN